MAELEAKRIINGTFGEAWLDDAKVSETSGLEANIEINKEEVSLPRQLATDTKMTGWKGSGTITLHKVSSRMAKAMQTMLKEGKDLRFTIISKLADPDSYGAERVAIKNVSFDSLTLANWEVNTLGSVEHPFTFTDYQFLDEIEG